MQGKVDTSFQTLQRDLFNSGMAAHIGANAFVIWLAIKNHADYNTGECWPGMRRLADLTGLAVGSVQKACKTLQEAKLLRIDKTRRKGHTYIARERMDIKLGDRVLCTIVLDYVPGSLRERLNAIEQGLKAGETNPDLWAQVEIIPGEGFVWDQATGVLRAKIHAKDLPAPIPDATHEQIESAIVKRLFAIKDRASKSVDK